MNRSALTGALLIVCALAVIAYWPAQRLPFIADDYIQIQLGRDYGPMQSWPALFRDPLYRCRATSVVLTYWTERLYGLNPFAYNLSSLLLHIVNCALLLALGAWRAVGWKLAFAAAAFFAVAEGHQEAVIWYAAVPELLVFLFSAASFLAFVFAITRSGSQQLWYATAVISFVFALASKESGVAAIGALLLACIVERVPLRRAIALLLPFGILMCVYVYGIFAASTDILHFHDGAFSLNAPFAKTILNSSLHLLWFWGITAIAVLAVWNRAAVKALLPASLCWMVISLFPYSFLTYMNRVPSRHTYLASVGLCLLVGVAILSVADHLKRPWTIALITVIIMHNCAYLWTKKQAQYERRAEATEDLLRAYRDNPAPIRIECFPYSRWIARYAVEIGAQRAWDESMWRPRDTCRPEETVLTVED